MGEFLDKHLRGFKLNDFTDEEIREIKQVLDKAKKFYLEEEVIKSFAFYLEEGNTVSDALTIACREWDI